MSSVWPKRLRLFGDAMRCLGADFTSTFETEKLASCALGFHDAVGEQREVIAGIQRKRAFFVLCVGNDAERQRTGYLDLPAVAERGEVPGIGKAQVATGVEHPAKAGDKAAVAGAHQFGVEAHQDRGGAQAFKSKGAQSTDGKHSRHGGFQALAAHIAHRNDNTAVGPRKDLVEVPTNFLCGQVRGFNVAAGKGRNRYGDQPLLDLPGGFELSGCPFVLKSDAAMAEQKDRANRDQEEEHRQVVIIKAKASGVEIPECGYGYTQHFEGAASRNEGSSRPASLFPRLHFHPRKPSEPTIKGT